MEKNLRIKVFLQVKEPMKPIKVSVFFFSRSTLICAQLIPKDRAVNGKSLLGSSALLVCSSDAYCASMEDEIMYFLVNFTSNKFCARGLEENKFCPAF